MTDYLHYYNLTRLHTANSYLTPVEYEMAFEKVRLGFTNLLCNYSIIFYRSLLFRVR
ncbi:IS3 family transposase [Xenorhabdus khoisanae]|uniref:IS3 family transposase n=1 Tax=Xenorhabdus khoisanae TaxID=880157 RepID=UPI003B58A9E9